VPISAKYRMVADAVSPLFSRALANAILKTLKP
jgi:site-specific DNA-cytosine methylase